MTYDSLLLNCGGGVTSTSQKSEQFGGAALCIGIGGTGVSALAELKRKVYQQLEPDDPNDAVPTYKHIQFLAIDSDETDIKAMRGNGKLDAWSEFFSIHMDSLGEVINNKNKIKEDPCMNWMDIDKIDTLLSPDGAGGIRQMGRFLLISKATELKAKITEKCMLALKETTAHLDVYIFAGISGGTGSGCFLDTCYIVRKVLEENGWGSKGNIMGFFFLPDVVTSKPNVASLSVIIQHNNANGYAAMKELDYLMNLQNNRDRFHQNYGSFTIDTQKQPVDLCHLLSARKADGSLMDNGFGYCIHVAADYVVAYLAQVDLQGVTVDKGLTMSGHLSNVKRNVDLLTRNYGAALNYHILGASSAEMPMSQISTYLAAGYYRRFAEAAHQDRKVTILDAQVKNFAQELGITTEKIEQELQAGCGTLTLPDMDMNELQKFGPVSPDKTIVPWGKPGEDWVNECVGKIVEHKSALSSPLPHFEVGKITSDSLISRVFKKLCELCCDPAYGPYYAAAMLHQAGEDLVNYCKGEKTQALKDENTMERLLDAASQSKAQASTTFCHPPLLANRKKLYLEYKTAVEQTYLIAMQRRACEETAKAFEVLQNNLQDLYNKFFQPLLQVLDNLEETFREDRNDLNSDKIKASTGYTWRIFELSEMKDYLDQIIDELTPKQLVDDFMTEVLSNPKEWLQNDGGKVGLFVSRYMEKMFRQDMNRSLQDYLFLKYPQAAGNVAQLAELVKNDILVTCEKRAVPMFWCNNAQFSISSSTFQSSSLSVPAAASAVCNAATSFAAGKTEFVVRKTGLKDRIFALRFISGIPFYAYQGMTLLKDDYDKSANAAGGVGVHLYAQTGRGTDGSGDKDWRRFLPTPVPPSVKVMDDINSDGKTVEQILELYEEGKKCDALYLDQKNDYYLRTSCDPELKNYKLTDFLSETGGLDENKLAKVKRELIEWLDNRYGKDPKKWTELCNNGKADDAVIKERVRRDYFVGCPVVQKAVEAEVEKYKKVQDALAKLEAIQSDYEKYEADLGTFCSLLFFRVITCLNGANKDIFDDQTEDKDIRNVVYRYTGEDGRNKEYILVRGSDYALADAFSAYCALNPVIQPRRQLDKIAVEKAGRMEFQPEEAKAAARLEDIYNPDKIEDIEHKVQTLLEEQQKRILRFYERLRIKISEFKIHFERRAWENAKKIVQSGAAGEVSSCCISFQGQTLTWYAQYPNFGWNAATNSYVPLTPNSPVYEWKNGAWVSAMTDHQGNFWPQ